MQQVQRINTLETGAARSRCLRELVEDCGWYLGAFHVAAQDAVVSERTGTTRLEVLQAINWLRVAPATPPRKLLAWLHERLGSPDTMQMANVRQGVAWYHD